MSSYESRRLRIVLAITWFAYSLTFLFVSRAQWSVFLIACAGLAVIGTVVSIRSLTKELSGGLPMVLATMGVVLLSSLYLFDVGISIWSGESSKSLAMVVHRIYQMWAIALSSTQWDMGAWSVLATFYREIAMPLIQAVFLMSMFANKWLRGRQRLKQSI